jgi:hypothetical protein
MGDCIADACFRGKIAGWKDKRPGLYHRDARTGQVARFAG